MINSPAKVLIFGGYNLLMNKIKNNKSYLPATALVGALVDKNSLGITASIKISSENRIISKLYNIDETPSLKSKNMVSIAMALAIKYLKNKRLYKNPCTIELYSSPIFGTPENKTGLGSSSASIATTIKATFEANGLNYNEYLDIIYKLSLAAYKLAGRTSVGFDFAVAVYERNVVLSKMQKINISFNNIDKEVKVNIIPTEALNELEVLIYDTGYSLNTEEAIKAFLKAYKKPAVKKLAREYFIKEYEGIKAILNHDLKLAGEKTREIRELLNNIWSYMDIDKDYEPEEIREIMKDIDKRADLVRLHGAGGESMLVLVKQKDKEEIAKYIEYNYPELKLIEAQLVKRAKNFKTSI